MEEMGDLGFKVHEKHPVEEDRLLHKELIDMYLFSVDDLIRQQEHQGKAKKVCLAIEDQGKVKAYRLHLIHILKHL